MPSQCHACGGNPHLAGSRQQVKFDVGISQSIVVHRLQALSRDQRGCGLREETRGLLSGASSLIFPISLKIEPNSAGVGFAPPQSGPRGVLLPTFLTN